MKPELKSILNKRLADLHCTRVPDWVTERLLPIVEAEATNTEAKAAQQLRRQVARQITVKTVAAAFVAGAPATGASGENREGFQGESANSPLGPTGNEGKGASRAAVPVVGHPSTATP